MPDEPTPPPQPILRSTDGREVDLRRDALTGSPAEQERHRIARTVLLQLLYDRSLDYWRGWATRGHIGAVCAEAIAEYEALAQAAGLPDRGALWREERYRAEREAIYERWAHALVTVLDLGAPHNRNMVLWAADHISATALAKQLQVPVLWLSLELQAMTHSALAVYTTG
jgi:hypothetical protein